MSDKDRRLGKTYDIVDMALPPNIIARAKLVEKIGPGLFIAEDENGHRFEVYSCSLRPPKGDD